MRVWWISPTSTRNPAKHKIKQKHITKNKATGEWDQTCIIAIGVSVLVIKVKKIEIKIIKLSLTDTYFRNNKNINENYMRGRGQVLIAISYWACFQNWKK